ncbi:putative bifunctional diguanylate cyclase/phosphodiesterase [Andreprevotia chitinilytica]|uniref:putative bifunctional diguanylate cyclase/phosphodiesterase n=1 Tax=Andreprevotia chitinilytica TaxID=396808 RepID=UPI0014700F8E|nr:bifunctional diguanylate cyclase/phosphodiesterase [Andreprevotia chitinilytica]
MLLFLLINLAATSIYTTYSYLLKSSGIQNEIDARLRSAVAAAPHMLPVDYIVRAKSPGTLADAEYSEYVHAFERYCKAAGLRYLYLFVLDGPRIHYLMNTTVSREMGLDDDGRFYSRSDTAGQSMLRAVADGGPHFAEYHDRYGDFRSLFQAGTAANGFRYMIGADVDISDIAGQMRAALMQSLMLGGLIFLLGALLSWWLALRLTQPVLDLVSAVRRIGQGDYSTRVEWHSNDEIGELAHGFNAMSEAVAERERDMRRLAYEDRLTNLPNRTLFIDRVELALRQGKPPFSVVLLDVDQFKYVNDYLGYQTGDAAIAALGRRLGTLMSGPGELCARLSGDAFAILLPDTDETHLPVQIGRIEDALADAIVVNGQRIDMGASIGVALSPDHGRDADLLLRHAEAAMYEAKRRHQGFELYEPLYEENRKNQLTLLGELREALVSNQFEVYYQPKVRISDGTVHSAEALIRWMHPDRGWVLPNLFIPFAEQTGKLRAITQWMVLAVLRQLEHWALAEVSICVSVNVGVSDVEDETFVDFIEESLAAMAVDAKYLCLEITETGVMNRPKELLRNLHRLRSLGVKLSIDDFGTGYSSFAYLAKMPVHELKIDQAFVTALEGNFENVSIVRSIIELGHILGLNVVAEGIESEAVWQALAVMGCDEAQGYMIAKPMPAEAFIAWRAKGLALPYTPPNMAHYT